jgi:hypothetical protein
LIAVLAALTDLTTDLNSRFVDALFDRTQVALHLLNVRARVGKCRTEIVDVGTQGIYVAAHASLLALEEIDLLRIDAGRQGHAEQQRRGSQNKNCMLHGITPTRKSTGPGESPSGLGDFFSSSLRCVPGIPEFLRHN